MILIVCVDERFGMGFNHRRQSSDRVVINRIIEISEGKRLWMDPYSALLFPSSVPVFVENDFLQKASSGDYCFAELIDVRQYISRVKKVVLFQWNTKYPADVYFPGNVLQDGWKMISVTEFAGSSHDQITMKVYER